MTLVAVEVEETTYDEGEWHTSSCSCVRVNYGSGTFVLTWGGCTRLRYGPARATFALGFRLVSTAALFVVLRLCQLLDLSMNFLSHLPCDLAILRGRMGCRYGALLLYFGCRYLSLVSIVSLLAYYDASRVVRVDVSRTLLLGYQG